MAVESKKDKDPRGEKTRMALIQAGLKLFGEHGFKSTTIRMLARHANANIAAIPYYFGSKDGLYLAVAEYIILQMRENIGRAFGSVKVALTKPDMNKEEALEHLETIANAMVHIFVENEEVRHYALIILKEQVKPTRAFDILYSGFMEKMHTALTILIAKLAGLSPEDDRAIIKSQMIMGEVIVFISSRELLLRRLGVNRLEKHQVRLVYELLKEHIEAVIDSGGQQ